MAESATWTPSPKRLSFTRVLSFPRSAKKSPAAVETPRPQDTLPTPQDSPRESLHDVEEIEAEPAISLPDIKPDDVVIAVMGVTGVGKSTFISTLSKTAVVGDGVQSCTSGVSIHATYLEGKDIYLIDTPGFDDTTRTDTSVLVEIAAWLKKSYDEKVKLAGVVYMHRISDTRVRGSGVENITLFKELCGEDALPCVVLTTSMWDLVPPEKAEQREKELISKEEFWGGLISHGCKVARQDNGSVSAATIIRHILTQKWPDAFQIQTEMAEGTPLVMTKAGKVLEERLEREAREAEEQRKKLQEEIERLKAETAEVERKAEEEREARKRQEEIEKLEAERRALEESEARRLQEEKESHEREEVLMRATEAETRAAEVEQQKAAVEQQKAETEKELEEARKRAEEAEKREAEEKRRTERMEREVQEAKNREQAEKIKRLESEAEAAAREIERLEREKAELNKAPTWKICAVM